MSEMLIEHPIAVINELLKLGIGDKGRLEYLKNAIKHGDKIYDSDKEFLKKMQYELEQLKSEKHSKSERQHKSYQRNDDISNFDQYSSSQNQRNNNSDQIIYSEFDSGADKIQYLITELKKNNSRLMDNLNLLTSTDSDLMYKLELLRLNREIASQSKIKRPDLPRTLFNLQKNNETSLPDSTKTNSGFMESRLTKIKKHELAIYASAGFLTLWYADYQNLIELGPFRNIAMGLSAGAAVAAALFYKKQKRAK